LPLTGGGAHKWAAEIMENLKGVKLAKLDEMEMMIQGINFLLEHANKEIFTFNWERKITEFEPKLPFMDYFPYILVNIGSGVSILKVDGPDKYERISGTSLGGGTFWGLCRLLTNITNFDEVKVLSQAGNSRNVDLIVGDIYGMDYTKLGLKSDIIASSFGKVATELEEKKTVPSDYKPADVVRSLLFMIANNIGQIAYLNAQKHNIKRMFFAGGFIQAGSYLWSRFSYAINFWSKGVMEPFFLLHDGYLGALGTIITNPDEETIKSMEIKQREKPIQSSNNNSNIKQDETKEQKLGVNLGKNSPNKPNEEKSNTTNIQSGSETREKINPVETKQDNTTNKKRVAKTAASKRATKKKKLK